MTVSLTQCPMHSGGMASMWLGGFLWNLVLIAVIVAVLYWLVKGSKSVRESPKDIAKRRLASGEITKKEYDGIIRELDK